MKKLVAAAALCLLLCACQSGVKSFILEFEGNPTTGYEWTVASADPSGIVEIEREYEPFAGGDAGTGGMYTFTVTALQSGETTLEFWYARPWESVQPLEKKVYAVSVNEYLNVEYTQKEAQ